MDPIQLKQALAEVRNLRKNILEKQLFAGYSGRARAIGGTVALLASCIAVLPVIRFSERELFVLWGLVFLLAVVVNYGAIVVWRIRNRGNTSNDVSFIFEIWPLWLVSGVLTLALWEQGQADLLYGSWMCLFGLGQTLYRSRLPKRIVWVGIYYILIGTLCLIYSTGLFLMPLIMGVTFFVGEFSAGFIMHAGDRTSGKLNLFASKPTIRN